MHNIANEFIGGTHKMKSKNYLLIALASVILIACSPDQETQTKDTQTILFEAQRNALEKAKAVESTVQQQAQEMQKNMDKQTQ
jgi:uncharacterized protein YcfL